MFLIFGMVCYCDAIEKIRPIEDSMYQCSHVYPVGSPALLLCCLHYQPTWQVFSTSCPPRDSHIPQGVCSLFLLKQTNKSELTCHHKLWVFLLVQILFSLLVISFTRALFREDLLRKWPQHFKTLQLGIILGIDSGILEEYKFCEELELIFWGRAFLYVVIYGTWLLEMRHDKGGGVKETVGRHTLCREPCGRGMPVDIFHFASPYL